MSFLRLLVSQGETKLNNITYKSGGTVMKTRTKLLAALLSTVTALSCALTAAAAPAITMQGNEMTPADGTKDGTLKFTVTATEFAEVAGADLEITIPDGVKPTAVTVTSNNNSVWTATNATADSGNYIFNATTRVLKIVDVFNVGNRDITALDLTVTVDFTAGATIGTYDTTNNVKLVNNDRNEITDVTVTNASLVVGKMSATINGAESGACFDDELKFLPYGSLMDGTTPIEKDNDGKFTFTGEKTVNYFKQPADNDVTTFGISRKAENDKNTIQFGSYINNIADTANSCGTVLVFSKELSTTLTDKGYSKGDFDGALAAADSLNDLLEGIVNAYKGVDDKTKFYPYVYDTNKIIYVRVVKQSRYMWKSSEADTLNKLQYAVRCQVSDVDRVFTAAGYICKTDDTYSFSKEVKSGSFSSLAG